MQGTARLIISCHRPTYNRPVLPLMSTSTEQFFLIPLIRFACKSIVRPQTQTYSSNFTQISHFRPSHGATRFTNIPLLLLMEQRPHLCTAIRFQGPHTTTTTFSLVLITLHDFILPGPPHIFFKPHISFLGRLQLILQLLVSAQQLFRILRLFLPQLIQLPV